MSQVSVNQRESSYDGFHKKNNDTNFLSNLLHAYISNEKPKIGDNLKLKQLTAPPKVNVQNECPAQCNRKTLNSWENLEEEFEDSSTRKFSTESQTSIYHHLKSMSSSSRKTDIYKVSFSKLLNDIKLLLMGIESESFKREENTLKFYATINWSCGDISDFSHFIESFIEAGTCFKRIKTYTSKSSFNQTHIFDGFLFKAFCDRVVRFLNHCRDLIYSQEVESALEFYENSSVIRKIIIHLAKFLNIHPSCSVNQITTPTGSEFLRSLYNEYTKIFDSNLKCFYIELLKSCCEVYYLHYQKWIYQGQFDDPHKELFIDYTENYTENTKQYFDKAYLIRKSSVPGFLQGCADNLLLCGKYTMLLRSFKPMVRFIKPQKIISLINYFFLSIHSSDSKNLPSKFV